MNTILVPLDGSRLAEQVLPYVRQLAPTLGARIHLLRVISNTEGTDVIVDAVATAYGGDVASTPRKRLELAWQTLRSHAEGYLYSQATVLQGVGLDVTYEVGFGEPAEVIVDAAGNNQSTLIAMATHGYSGLRRWTLGSVADKVVHSTETPVLIVRGALPPDQKWQLNTVMVPLDGSELARHALPFATELATCAQAELLLMEAIPPALEVNPGMRPLGRPIPQLAGMIGELREHARQELSTQAEELSKRELRATPLVTIGYAAEAIVDLAERRSIDLIVMATHGRSGISRWALGSVADKVLHATYTPLVLVRARENIG